MWTKKRIVQFVDGMIVEENIVRMFVPSPSFDAFMHQRRYDDTRLDPMEAWLERERDLTIKHKWFESRGNEFLKSTFPLFQEFLEVHAGVLQGIRKNERMAAMSEKVLHYAALKQFGIDEKKRKKIERWFQDSYLDSQERKRGIKKIE